jgi:pilus assembly protein CpaF
LLNREHNFTHDQMRNANVSYIDLRKKLQQSLFEKIDLDRMKDLSVEQFKIELSLLVEKIIQDESMVINQIEKRKLVLDMQHEMIGLGPLEILLEDPTISDILVNTSEKIYIERKGKLELTPIVFQDNQHLLRIIEKIVSRVGRRVDESSPMVDARLHDGSRVNAIIPPIAIDGPILSIRRFSKIPLRMGDLLSLGSLSIAMSKLLIAISEAKLNILISGGTGSGKTTLLNVLSGYIPHSERIITIEDAAELQMQQPHVVRLETRPPNIEGNGAVTQRALVRNALRMRPDRIILGEVRDSEAFDMLQAMNTGHEGSLATIHANSARDALSRLENMVGMAESNLSQASTRQQISSAITVVIQVMRLIDGGRRIVSIQELTGMEGEIITMQEIFAFNRVGVDEFGKVVGNFKATGICPQFHKRFKEFGISLSESIYDPNNKEY